MIIVVVESCCLSFDYDNFLNILKMIQTFILCIRYVIDMFCHVKLNRDRVGYIERILLMRIRNIGKKLSTLSVLVLTINIVFMPRKLLIGGCPQIY